MSSHLYLYSAFYNTDCIKKQLHSENMKIMQQENCINIHLKEGRSIILLNIKCPQLSKPKAKATVARNQNSIR